MTAERRIGGDSEICEQCERGVRVGLELGVQRGLIELSDLGRYRGECLVLALEAAAVERPAPALADLPTGVPLAQRAALAGREPAGGALGLPDAGSAAGARARSSSSAITSSALRS